MSITLDFLARQCSQVLAQSDTPAGRTQVAQLLVDALRDGAFLAEVFEGPASERRIVHEDSQLGFRFGFGMHRR